MLGWIKNSMSLKLGVGLRIVDRPETSPPMWIELPDPMPAFGTAEFNETRVIVNARRDILETKPFPWVVAGFAHELSHVVLFSIGHRLQDDIAKIRYGWKSKVKTAHRPSQTGHQPSEIGISAFIGIGAAAILSIVMLPVLFRGSADSSVHTDRPAAVAPLQGANRLNPPPSDITAAQNRLIELRFLKGPADGVWGIKSRTALRAFKIANGLAADDKWDDFVSGRLYSTRAARSPVPLATTSPAQ
jgi:hypothetical protein